MGQSSPICRPLSRGHLTAGTPSIEEKAQRGCKVCSAPVAVVGRSRTLTQGHLQRVEGQGTSMQEHMLGGCSVLRAGTSGAHGGRVGEGGG